MLRVLAVGDVCGSAGVEYLKKNLRLTAEANGVDLIVVNGENAADIHGISVADVSRLFKAGADVITTGNHAFGRPALRGRAAPSAARQFPAVGAGLRLGHRQRGRRQGALHESSGKRVDERGARLAVFLR